MVGLLILSLDKKELNLTSRLVFDLEVISHMPSGDSFVSELFREVLHKRPVPYVPCVLEQFSTTRLSQQ